MDIYLPPEHKLDIKPPVGQVFIYLLLDDDDRPRYVGKTEQVLHRRLNAHLRHAAAGRGYHLGAWIRQLGHPPKMRIVGLFLMDEWEAAERAWIGNLRASGYDLVNIAEGGEGHGGWNHTEETKQRLSAALKGRKRSPAAVAATAAARRGKKVSLETRARLRASNVGKTYTPHRQISIEAPRSCALCQCGPFTGFGMRNHRRGCR